MKIETILWKDEFLDKIIAKHGVTAIEVEEILLAVPHIRRAETGHVKGEHLYAAYGQAESGRYLLVFFINKSQGVALPITARDMTDAERDYYHDQAEAT